MVCRSRQIIQLKDDFLATSHGDIACCPEAADAVVDGRRRRRVVDVDVLRRACRKVRSKGEAKQTTFTQSADGDGEEGCGEQLSIFDDTELTVLLTDEQAAVGCEGHRGRIREATSDQCFCKATRQRRRTE